MSFCYEVPDCSRYVTKANYYDLVVAKQKNAHNTVTANYVYYYF